MKDVEELFLYAIYYFFILQCRDMANQDVDFSWKNYILAPQTFSHSSDSLLNYQGLD
jgi:hypothetical protein